MAGVRPTIRLASAPIASTRLVLASMATTDGSLMTMPAVADMDQRVGGAEVDADVAGEEAEEAVEHAGGQVLAAWRTRRAARGRRDGTGDERGYGSGPGAHARRAHERGAVYRGSPDAQPSGPGDTRHLPSEHETARSRTSGRRSRYGGPIAVAVPVG